MANYVNTTQLRSQIDLPNISVQIEQLAGTNNTTTQNTIIEQFLENACGVVDAYLNTLYTVPVTTAADNNFLRSITLDIAVYELFKRGSGDDVPKKYRTNYEDSIRSLEDIAEGGMTVPGVASKIINTSVEFVSDDTLFTEDDLTLYT